MNTGWIWNPEVTSAHCNLDNHECRVWRGNADNEWHFSVKPTGRLGMTTTGETYSADHAIERVEKCVGKGTFRIKAHAIVKELGADWKVATPKDDDSIFDKRVEFLGPDGAKLYLSADGYRNLGKMNVSGGHQNHNAYVEHRHYDEKMPEINVSLAKSAKQIAADISRRLLPDLAVLVKATYERMGKANDYQALTIATAEALAKSIKGHVQTPGKYASASQLRTRTVRGLVGVDSDGDKIEISLEVNGARVDLPSMGVTADEAAAVVAVLTKLRARKVGK
jgi:hypothetical protein